MDNSTILNTINNHTNLDFLSMTTMIDVGVNALRRETMTHYLDKSKYTSNHVIRIGTDDVRKRMGEILDCVKLRGDEFLIERKNKPMAVLIPIQKHEALQKMAREFITQTLLTAGKELTDEEAMELANEAKHASRENII